MCGIVGGVTYREIGSILLEGLKRLEYRGYDSAGIAIVTENRTLERLRVKGKVQELFTAYYQQPIKGNLAIAHTRWATHGEPSEENAHPHISNNQVALVHNGIIENYEILREKLITAGYKFVSETDTEVIVHLMDSFMQHGCDLLQATQQTIKELEGAYALAIVSSKYPDRLIAVRCGSPLVIGLGMHENFIGSDCLALLPVTQKFIYLEEGDIAEITKDKVNILDAKGQNVERAVHTSKLTADATDRGEYRHFMQKEIMEQPNAIRATLEGRLGKNRVFEAAFGIHAEEIFTKTKHVMIVACGTSYHAGMIARYWLEEIAGIFCTVEIASEYRYRHAVVLPGTLFVSISQSGETADTLAALRISKKQAYLASLAICNVPESSLVRESDLVFMTRAGVEIGVASTKAFTTQLTALLMFTFILGRYHQIMPEKEASLVMALKNLPQQMEAALSINEVIKSLAQRFADKNHTLFLGRGSLYPVAMEGALKLKEISYIHAEAYPAGELKHGPLALVDKNMPVVVVAPNDDLLEKLKSNLEEVHARGGELIVFADETANIKTNKNLTVIEIPKTTGFLSPIIYTLPLQLLAYHVAVIKGTDVDQPRNLAKSVTVE